MYPEELLYAENHEWLKVENGIGTVGITHYAQDQLGDLVFIELPHIGDEFAKDAPFGVIESVKAVSDFYMPAGGTITEVNEDLMDAPEIINEDPYEEGWIIKIEIADEDELEELMDADTYTEYLEEL